VTGSEPTDHCGVPVRGWRETVIAL